MGWFSICVHKTFNEFIINKKGFLFLVVDDLGERRSALKIGYYCDGRVRFGLLAEEKEVLKFIFGLPKLQSLNKGRHTFFLVVGPLRSLPTQMA